jgi:hypothetical protein
MAAASRGGRVSFTRQRLTPPTSTSTARGRAFLITLSHHGNQEGSLDVFARGLAATATFDVLVDGVKIGNLQSNDAGGGHARFRSHPHGRALILGVDPRGKRLVVRDTAGADVLAGDWPLDGHSVGKVACCILDSASGAFAHDRHRGSEHGHGHHGDDDDHDCRLKTVDECAQVGGTSAGGSCLPDPCENDAPAPDGTVCCIPGHGDDEDGAECEHRSPAACLMAGGAMVSAAGCDPNPCAGAPASGPAVVVCCLPHGNEGAECEHRTAEDCVAQGGVDQGPGRCFPDPCAGSGDDGDGGHGGHGGPGRRPLHH